jgi:PLP dependent protein
LTDILENLAHIKDRLQIACSRAGRDPQQVRLVGVTKTVAIDRVRQALAAGVSVLGENYVQEARRKIELLADLNPEWHFIGHLQSNKAKMAVELFDWIQTVDRESLALALNREATNKEKSLSVLIQVNVGGEETKSGASPGDLFSLYRSLSKMEALQVRGLMTLPPYCENPQDVRPYLQKLSRLLEQLRQTVERPEQLTELSMGMSHDFEVAIEEGATLIRIGTALFGARPKV